MDQSSSRTTGDFFCELCGLEFTDRNEKLEHSWSMLHNTNLNKKKGRECIHKCALCGCEFTGLLAFTSHLHNKKHKDKLCAWRKETQPKEDVVQSRQRNKNELSKMRDSEHARSPREVANTSSESHVSTDRRVHNLHRYHWKSADYRGKLSSVGGPKESDSSHQLGNSGLSLYTDFTENSHRVGAREDHQVHRRPLNPNSMEFPETSIDRSVVRDHQSASSVRPGETSNEYQGLPRRTSFNSEQCFYSEEEREPSRMNEGSCNENTNNEDRRTPDSQDHRSCQSSPEYMYRVSNVSVSSNASETRVPFDSESERNPRKGRPRKVAKRVDSSRESRAEYVLQSSGGVIKSMKQTTEDLGGSWLNETDEQKANETRTDVNLREQAQQTGAVKLKEGRSFHEITNASTTLSGVQTLDSASSQRQKEQALRILLGVKKEPGTQSEGHVSCTNCVKVKQEPCDSEHVSSSVQETVSPSLTSPQQCLFMHIDGVRCGAIAVDRYCSYHQILHQKQQTQNQQASVAAVHRRTSPPGHIDLNSSLDLRPSVVREPRLPTINLNDTVPQPSASVFGRETNRSPGEGEFRSGRETVVAPREASPSRILHQEDTARSSTMPRRVLAFNPEKLAHPGGELPKVSAFGRVSTGLPHRESYNNIRVAGAGPTSTETRENQRCSTQSGKQADTGVGMIDLSSSSQFLGFHALQQPSIDSVSAMPNSRPPFGLHGEKTEAVRSPGIASEETVSETGRAAASTEFVSLSHGRSQDNSRNSSPSPSNLTVDLSRFNLPSAVRRALAIRLGTKKHNDSAEDDPATKPASPRPRFADEARGLVTSERTKQTPDSQTSSFTPVRRVRRSVSLDSRPKKLDALQREGEALGTTSVRQTSPVFGSSHSRNESRAPSHPHAGGFLDAPPITSSPQSRVSSSVNPSIGTITRASSSLETRGMIDLSSVAYLEAAGKISSTKKDSFSSQVPHENARMFETQTMELPESFRGDVDNGEFPQVSSKRKRVGSVDEAGMGTRDDAGSSASFKKMRSLEESKQNEDHVSYTPGVNIQELLTIEREEQRQLGALGRVQSQLKDVRSQIQRLCTVLDGLHAEENSITTRMDQLRSARLHLLQNALCEQRDSFSRNTRTSSLASSSTEEPSGQVLRAGDGDLASSSCAEPFPQRSAADERVMRLADDAFAASASRDADIALESGSHQDVPNISNAGVSAESCARWTWSFPLNVKPDKETQSKSKEAAVSRLPDETETDYESAAMDLGSDAAGTDYEVQSMDLGSDSADGAQTGRGPAKRDEQKVNDKASHAQSDKPSHRARFGRILNQTRARVSLALESEGSEEVGPTQPRDSHESGGAIQPRALQRGGSSLQRRRANTRAGETGELTAVYLTNRHRREVVRNIKLQQRAPKNSTLENRASSALAISKQKLQSARENMSRWKEQSEKMGESPVPVSEGGADTCSATPRVARQWSTPAKTTKDLKKSSLFKTKRVSPDAQRLKRQRRKERRARVKVRHGSSGVDLNKTAQLGLALANFAEAGSLAKKQRRRSSSSTAVLRGESSQRGPSPNSTSEASNRGTPSSTTVSQKKAPSTSTTVPQDRVPRSSRAVCQTGASLSSTAVPQNRAPTSTTTVSQIGAFQASTTVPQRRTSCRTSKSQKGTSSSVTAKPNKRASSENSNLLLRKKDAEGEGGKLEEPGCSVMTVKCEPEDYKAMINEVPTRDVGNEPTTPDHLKLHPSVESSNEKIVEKGRERKRVGQAVAGFQGQTCHTGAVCGLKVSGNHLFTCSTDKTTKSYDVQTGDCVKTYLGHHHGVNCLEVSDDGSRLFTGSNDQTVRSYDIKTSACTHKFTFDGRVMCVHLAFDTLFVGLSTGIVTCINVKENRCLERLHCHDPRGVSCLATATEGQRRLLCSGSFDSTITITDFKSGLLLRTLKDHDMTVLCIQVVENVIYSGSADKRVQAHNINTGELLRSYDGHTKTVSGLQIVGRVLVTSCLDKLIRCYDVTSAELLQVYGGQSDMLFSVHMANGHIFSGARDGSVSCVKLDLRVYHPCKWKDCALKFGILSHLKSHVQESHVIKEGTIQTCHWTNCQYKFSATDDIQAVLGHILSHTDASKSAAAQAK